MERHLQGCDALIHLAFVVTQYLARAEMDAIKEALRITNEDKAKAAALLGISVRTLYRKLEKLTPTSN